MRTPFIAANWKMYKTVQEAVAFIKEFRTLVKDVHDVEIVVAPPFTAVRAVAEAAHATNIGVAGQNVYWEREGAFTGEVSAPMLKEAGAEYVIIGHSERRRLFGETDQTVNRKVLAAVAAQLTPIVCIGETLDEREGNKTLDGARPPDQGWARRPVGRPDRRPGRRLRARVGHRHRPQRDAGAGRRGARAHPQPHPRSGSAAARPTTATSSTAAASSRTTSGSCRRSPTWTAPWSAAPASTCGAFSTSFRAGGQPRRKAGACG